MGRTLLCSGAGLFICLFIFIALMGCGKQGVKTSNHYNNIDQQNETTSDFHDHENILPPQPNMVVYRGVGE